MESPGFSNAADKLVLIVDDDNDLRELLGVIVRKEGFRVETAVDGEDAQAKARALSPDLILLDLMLPKAGGFEILQALQEGETSDIKIIIMTGRNLDRTTSEMIKQQSNVKDFVEKPLKTEVLISRLHQLLKTRPIKRT